MTYDGKDNKTTPHRLRATSKVIKFDIQEFNLDIYSLVLEGLRYRIKSLKNSYEQCNILETNISIWEYKDYRHYIAKNITRNFNVEIIIHFTYVKIDTYASGTIHYDTTTSNDYLNTIRTAWIHSTS